MPEQTQVSPEHARAEAAFSASREAPIRQDVVDKIKGELMQTFYASGASSGELWLGPLIFQAQHFGWRVSEIEQARFLVEEEKGGKLVLGFEPRNS